MHPLSSFPDVDPAAFDLGAWYNLVGAAGCVFWVLAYVVIVRKSFQDRAYGLPMIAIALNFAWEILASFVFPNPVWLWHTFDRVWLAVDVVLVYQLWRFGPDLQRIPELKRWFHPAFVVTVGLGLWGQWAFFADYPDRLGLVVAFLINLVMSVAFVLMYFERRPALRGISVPGAWFKMLGTLGTAIECHVVVPMVDPELASTHFLTFLSIAIFAFDCLYIGLVSSRATGSVPGVQPS